MSKYTKKQRHEIYKKALKRLQNDEYKFICYAIKGEVSYGFNYSDFPEFDLFNPGIDACVGGWFNLSTSEDYSVLNPVNAINRQQILMFCIEMTR